jgi:hypothetical protein
VYSRPSRLVSITRYFRPPSRLQPATGQRRGYETSIFIKRVHSKACELQSLDRSYASYQRLRLSELTRKQNRSTVWFYPAASMESRLAGGGWYETDLLPCNKPIAQTCSRPKCHCHIHRLVLCVRSVATCSLGQVNNETGRSRRGRKF